METPAAALPGKSCLHQSLNNCKTSLHVRTNCKHIVLPFIWSIVLYFDSRLHSCMVRFLSLYCVRFCTFNCHLPSSLVATVSCGFHHYHIFDIMKEKVNEKRQPVNNLRKLKAPTFILHMRASTHLFLSSTTHMMTHQHPETITHLYLYYTSYDPIHTPFILAIPFLTFNSLNIGLFFLF